MKVKIKTWEELCKYGTLYSSCSICPQRKDKDTFEDDMRVLCGKEIDVKYIPWLGRYEEQYTGDYWNIEPLMCDYEASFSIGKLNENEED